MLKLTYYNDGSIYLKVEESLLSKLSNLHIGYNQLKVLVPEVFMLPNLYWLELSGNPITDIPLEITKCQNLRTIEVSTDQAQIKKQLQWLHPNCNIWP